uniref:Uncharacterized protein LOC123613525 isoform X2 n=1 Tax=Camelus bactrianus TaxID=9837 RepID=A0A9W3HA67_CAMBA|nr:uncharacterized protein LOC123613525 isoform X2 [Camelus bactrianus]
MSQPRAALLRHRPPLSPVFPPSCLPSSPLPTSPAPSKQPRCQAAAVAATPSGGIRGNRAERRKGAGRGGAGARRRSEQFAGRAPSRVRSVHARLHRLRSVKVEGERARLACASLRHVLVQRREKRKRALSPSLGELADCLCWNLRQECHRPFPGVYQVPGNGAVLFPKDKAGVTNLRAISIQD